MRKLVIAALLGTLTSPVFAKEAELACTSGPDCQRLFQSISEDIIATVDYKAVGPAEATGLLGFGAGLVASYVPVDSEEDWEAATGDEFEALGMAGVQVTKGLPFGIDVGAFYSTVPSTDVDVFGGELRFAILKGSTVSPALALRATYVTVSGIESFDLDTSSVELALSKGFTLITPYVGVGYVMGEADPESSALETAEVEDTKAYIGARITLGFIEFTPEIGQVGDNTTYSTRLGFSFSL